MTMQLDLAAYWRASLADAALGTGTFTKDELDKMQACTAEQWSAGVIAADIVRDLFQGEEADTETVEVLLRPFVYHKRHEHGVQRLGGGPEWLLPVVCKGVLQRDGRISPGTALVARELLEPLEQGSFAIGQIAGQDAFLDNHIAPLFSAATTSADEAHSSLPERHAERWKAYREYCARLLAGVAASWDAGLDGYCLVPEWYVVKRSSAHKAVLGLLGLLDHLRRSDRAAPLFARYAGTTRAEQRQCLQTHDGIAARVGHGTGAFALADAQRRALNHVLQMGDGEIIALNGPPGTGKTTMLLSVVANLWIRAALDGKEPPVIVAASANNQAVTNIIDAFGQVDEADHPLGGRWLPKLQSYGSYFPAQSKMAVADKRYHTQSFFNAAESRDYVESAHSCYLQRAALAYPGLASVGDAVALLREQLQASAALLAGIEATWQALQEVRAATIAGLGGDPTGALKAHAERQQEATVALGVCKRMHGEWLQFLADEPIWYALLGWLKPVERKRTLRARAFLHPHRLAGAGLSDGGSVAEMDAAVAAALRQCEAALQAASAAHAHAVELVQAESCLQEQWTRQCRAAGVDPGTISIGQVDEKLDTQVRYRLFQLATHYWEGRWLEQMQALLPQLDGLRSKTGAGTVMPRWRRRMMLTPCAVSTFYMLPSLMQVQRKDDSGFVPDYLYNFIDLLIVDEAGQVLPQVAGPAFALARKALVIGDVRQIEPVWSIPKRVDIGNLLELGLLPGDTASQAYRAFSATGRSAANGSVMRTAQHACHYHEDPELDPGLYLYEHRRSWNEIIAYPDKLCYREKLVKCRGKAPAGAALPAMGYLHIDGRCERANGGSRYNRSEAAAIAAWLAAQREAIEEAYGKPLEQLAAVITPFSPQVRMIETACREAGIKVGKEEGAMTIGTVHALQGAERSIVLFSPVYSKHDNGPFIDRSPSMLNVAVSRAKDSFLVFGDMDTFEEADRASPRGLLAEYLMQGAGSRLKAVLPPARADLVEQHVQLSQLQDAAEHDAFLLDTLRHASNEVHVVSPWILQGRMIETGIWQAMCAAAGRGVRVVVYTDLALNADDTGQGGKYDRLDRTAIKLAAEGVEIAYVRRLHSKIVMADRRVYCVGSFNWLSAARKGDYVRHETSLLYRGDGLGSEIDAIMESLAKRRTARLASPPHHDSSAATATPPMEPMEPMVAASRRTAG